MVNVSWTEISLYWNDTMKTTPKEKQTLVNRHAGARAHAPVRRVFGLALLVSMPALVAISCGGEANPDALSGESHFLSRCTSSCGDRYDCINALCTRGCLVDDSGDATCQSLSPVATCTADSVEPGSVAVCDFACTTPVDCSSLGAQHACEAGYCRAPESSGLSCASYRNRRANDRLTVSIRNERETPIFLQPYLSSCTDSPHLVRASRAGREVNLHNPFFCGGVLCESIQDGTDNVRDCPDECARAAVVRLAPASEIEVGTFRSEFVSHGVVLGTAPMPSECIHPRSQYEVGNCASEAPLTAGQYELTAQAFTECGTGAEGGPGGGSCVCQPQSDGSCTTGAFVPIEVDYEPISGGITATTVVDLPTRSATLVFQ